MNKKTNSNPQIELLAALLEHLQPLGLESTSMDVVVPQGTRDNYAEGWFLRYEFSMREQMSATTEMPVGTWINNALRDVGIDPDSPEYQTEEKRDYFFGNTIMLHGMRADDHIFDGVQVIIPLNVFKQFRKDADSVDPIGLVTTY